MARDTLGLDILDTTDIWGYSGDKTELPSIHLGYDSTYETTKYPNRKHLNDFLAKLGSCALDYNRFGSLAPWDTTLIYQQYAWVTGSDGKIYRSKAGGNLAHNPVTTGGVYWDELEANILGIPDIEADVAAISEMIYSGTQVFTGESPIVFTDLSLAGVVGSNRAFVHLSVESDEINDLIVKFRPNGETADVGETATSGGSGTTQARIDLNKISYLSMITDTGGLVEWTANSARDATIKVLCYQVLK